MTQSTTEALSPTIVDAQAQQPQQPWHSSRVTDQRLVNLYRETPHGARPNLIAKTEAGVQMEDLQAVIIQWIMVAAAGSHVNA